MPIRINLLAEAKAAEEMRRHDPVKRVVFVGAFFVAVFLVWSSSLQLQCLLAKKSVTDRQTAIETRTNEYQRVLLGQQKITEVKEKLEKLRKFTNSRFLQGNLLNALQQVHVDNVRLLRLKVDQSYLAKNGPTPKSPGTVTEKIVVWLDARDSSTSPGDQVNKMKEAVANQSYFKAMLNKTNGVLLANQPMLQTSTDGKPYVLFTLECNFPEVSR